MNLVKVIDKGNDFKLLIEIDFSLANNLNIGDHILPKGTGFAFKIIEKYISMDDNGEYSLKLNVVEYKTFNEKLKRIFGFKFHSYWDLER